MGLRTAHGTGADALLRIETLPADELPAGVPGDAGPESPSDRGPGGLFARRNKQSVKGGKAKAGQTRLAVQVGFTPPVEGAAWTPYRRLAATFRREHCRQVALTVGGGICGTGPSSIIASAALALAASRYLYDTAEGDGAKLIQAARLADSSRQALLTAHELAAREATARHQANPRAKHEAWRARIEAAGAAAAAASPAVVAEPTPEEPTTT